VAVCAALAGDDEPDAELTLRNATERVVEYRIEGEGPDRNAAGSTRLHQIAPGEVRRLDARSTIRLAVMQHGEWVSYPLEPGRAYSLRLNESGAVEPFEGSHGRPDAPDLAPFVVTPPNVVARMLSLAEVDVDDVVYDLGCGDGRIVIAAARLGARGVGIELDAELIRRSERGAEEAGVADRASFMTQDIMKVDLSAATVVTMYLLPESNALLRDKLESELRPGARVVSNQYDVPGWEATRTISVRGPAGEEHILFLYRR
jgi:2-polyprenyl-3-methyl-5-hydroxy-6-metoxy-1,4-benzoquinol methylase